MSQKTYMYDTQWNQLINAINTGDSSAVVTALTTIKNSLDNITNAISNQTITVDLSDINSDNVLNLSNVTGGNITNAFNNLNSTLNDMDNFFISEIKEFRGLQNNSSVNVNITIPDINVGIAYFVVCHCGGDKGAGAFWTVDGLPFPGQRQYSPNISIPIPQDWDNAVIVSVPLNVINANTYNITFTNLTGASTDNTYASSVYVMVIKLK